VRRFRTIWKWLLPGWAQRGEGALVQYTQGLVSDAFAERCRQTVWTTLPSLTPSDALPLMANDRGLLRGLFEPEASFRGRLAAWRYPRGHRVRGSALALLEQVSVALRGSEWTTIDARGTRVDASTGDVTRSFAWDWDGEALLPNWGRYWVVALSGEPQAAIGEGAWGGTVGNPDACVGVTRIHPGEIDAVRRLTRPFGRSWSPAGRRAVYLTIRFDGDPFPTPDGTWDDWENRDTAYRYVPLHSSVT
jgi:hypothetical protein